MNVITLNIENSEVTKLDIAFSDSKSEITKITFHNYRNEELERIRNELLTKTKISETSDNGPC